VSGSGSRGLDPRDQVESFSDTYDGLSGALVSGVGGVIAAVFISMVWVIEGIRSLLVDPILGLVGNVGDLTDALFGGVIRILNQTATTAVLSVAPGQTWAIGPFTWLLGVAVFGISLYMLSQILALAPTSNLVPGTFTDYPIIGVDERQEGEE